MCKWIKSQHIEEVATATLEKEMHNIQATTATRAISQQTSILHWTGLKILHKVFKFYPYKIYPVQQWMRINCMKWWYPLLPEWWSHHAQLSYLVWSKFPRMFTGFFALTESYNKMLFCCFFYHRPFSVFEVILPSAPVIYLVI